MDLDPNDRLVAELDVEVCNDLQQLKSNLVLLQQPLRPAWRPYNVPSNTTARFKPNAKRLELQQPLDPKCANYNEGVEEIKRVTSLTLRSSLVDPPKCDFAVGVIRNGRLLLLPVNYTLQLRPHLSHLNADTSNKAKAGGQGEDTDEEMGMEDNDGPEIKQELTAIEVQVKRRETERQQAARLKSYTYLQQEEEAEAWVNLQVHHGSSAAAGAIWDKVLQPAPAATAGALPPLLGRTAYLNTFLPSAAPHVNPLSSAAAGTFAGAAAADGSAAAGTSAGFGSSGPVTLTPEMAAAVKPALQALFYTHPVCNQRDIRSWLQQWSSTAKAAAGDAAAGSSSSSNTTGEVRKAAFLTDKALHELLVGPPGKEGQGGEEYTFIRHSYVARAGTTPACEGMRAAVLSLLKDKQQLKKGDIQQVFQTAGQKMSETQYQKVMKELCRNHGNTWSLKQGADW
jgi:DNA-directed RNA polymerase-3 subunit RPC5